MGSEKHSEHSGKDSGHGHKEKGEHGARDSHGAHGEHGHHNEERPV